MSEQADHLLEQALALGADVAGWAAAVVPSEVVTEYEGWLAEGRHAGMDYLERQLPVRANPSQRLEGIQSVLVLGVSHAFAPLAKPSGGVRLGRVARYAQTPDYHEQLLPLIQSLEQKAAQLGIRAKGYIDHGPIMERLFGAGAFLGWRGKSGMLVNTDSGAFVTLAVLLTDLPIQPPPPHPDRCGRCVRCISACPTGALGTDRKLDARRCISYLTIEHRGAVPLELREGLGEWLFGCDVCSEICPWSVRAGEKAHFFQPLPDLVYPNLERFFGVSERQFEREWRGTAFLRARRKGMARNAMYLLGNVRDEAGWSLLGLGARDAAWEVRDAAAWAFSRWEAWAELEAMRHDPDERVAEQVERLLEMH